MKAILDIIIMFFKKMLLGPVPINPQDPQMTPMQRLQFEYMSRGYIWDDEINVFGGRDPKDQNLDIWNDIIGIALPKTGEIFIYEGTTDPGKYWTEQGGFNPDKKGVAHLCLGQYRRAYEVGMHADHLALRQVGMVKLWRDKNRDYVNNDNIVIEGNGFGINIHGGWNSKIVHNTSAGCQVIRSMLDQSAFMDKVMSTNYYKNNPKELFDYTLFNLSDIKGALK